MFSSNVLFKTAHSCSFSENKPLVSDLLVNMEAHLAAKVFLQVVEVGGDPNGAKSTGSSFG